MMTLSPDLHVLSDEILERLGSTQGSAVDEGLAELQRAGYLLMAVPVELGGLGGNLAQVCAQQRRLARRAPAVAQAVNPHLCRTGVAADLRRANDHSLASQLEKAAAGGLLACGGAPGESAGVVDEAWTRLTSAAISAGIGGRVLELTAECVVRRVSAMDGEAQLREMALEVEGASLLLDRIADDWSADLGHAHHWPSWIAAVNHRAIASTRRVVDLSLALICGNTAATVHDLSQLARAAARQH
jgi:alkylation response protein AidB-like acyl-CoA dehydrogenase